MKRMFFIINLLIVATFTVIAQDNAGLEIRKLKNSNSRFVSEGAKVQVVKNHRIYKGKLKVISDKSILINSDTILISQIQEFRAKTFSNQIGGIALAVPGSILGGFGLYAIGIGLAEGGWGFLAVIIGIPPAVVGIPAVIVGIKQLSKGKRFNPSKWEYKVVEQGQKQASN